MKYFDIFSDSLFDMLEAAWAAAADSVFSRLAFFLGKHQMKWKMEMKKFEFQFSSHFDPFLSSN